MASMLVSLLETAIYNKASATLLAAVGNRFKHGASVAGWDKPYVLYSFSGLVGVDRFKKTTPDGLIVHLYFDVFDDSDFITTASTICGHIMDSYDGQTLTLTGYANMDLIRNFAETPLEDPDTGLWHLNLHYWGTVCAT